MFSRTASLAFSLRSSSFRLSSAPSRTASVSLVAQSRITAAALAHVAKASTKAGMPIEQSMKQKLTEAFQPTALTIRNDSSKHAHHAAMVAQGGGSGETHFFVEVVSKAFEGKSQIQRHRAINALMADEFTQGLHALSLRTKTPEEVEKEKTRI